MPLLDMLQHSASPNVRHAPLVDPETGVESVVVRARQPLAAGTELMNCYNDELDALLSRRVRERIESLGIEPMRFRDLASAPAGD